MRSYSAGDSRTMDGFFNGVPGGVATVALAGLGKWFYGRIRKDGSDAAEAQRIEERDTEVRVDMRSLRDELRKAVDTFQSQSLLTTELRSSQAVVNQMVAKAMDAIGTKQERHSDMLADHAATLRLLTDNVGLLRQRIDQVEKGGR